MGHPVLEKDAAIRFPHVMVLKASAGSGKTHTLSERFVQFLLSNRIAQNHPRHILALTFSNNAAKEMKQRILSWLKDLSFGDAEKMEDLSQILSLKKEYLPAKSEAMIEEILRHYTEFQVKTIDSFMTSIYKASAIDLGQSPDFEIVMDARPMIAYAFNRFLRQVKEGAPETRFLEGLMEILHESRKGESKYLWDPSKDLLEEIVELHERISGVVGEVRIVDVEKEMESTKREICEVAERLNELVEGSDLPKSRGSSFSKILGCVKSRRFPDLLSYGLTNPPVLKPKKADHPCYEKIRLEWSHLGEGVRKYKELYGRDYCTPYVKAYQAIREILEDAKRREERIFIHDMNKKLSTYLSREMIPDVYFRIGETIYHYLIDEFQDTSPIQWRNLFPLIENSLSQGGSLFAVGDTKQAIYGFRNADYEIMKGLESKNPFPSADHTVKELEANYRSLEGLVQFSKTFFQRVVANHETYRDPADRSGLVDYEQKVKDGRKAAGYAQIVLCQKDADQMPEKERLQELIGELRGRGYAYSDIAILTYRNENVVNVTAWLNEKEIPFISSSSLDIRRRKPTAEIVALLKFLDSPPDDLSFATFILGDIFRKSLKARERALRLERLHQFFFRCRRARPLYKAFQEEFPELWRVYFEDLFRLTGYLPLYDLVNEIYRIYDVFDHFRAEEATLVKILEVIKDFEGRGKNNLADFLRRAADDEGEESNWAIDVPKRVDAVQVMTIHRAKGLGFPVVVLLLYEDTTLRRRYVLHEEVDGIHLLKLTQKILDASPFFNWKYEQEKLKDLVNKLNTLYVGLTRAEDELYVIGVRGERNAFPIDLLELMESPIGSKNGPRVRSSETSEGEWKVYHHSGRMSLPLAGMGEFNLEERRRGEFIHQVLSLIEEVEEPLEPHLERMIERVNQERNTAYPIAEMKRTLLPFLSHPEIRPFFQKRPGRMIQREQDVSDRSGALFRMDRVVVDEAQAVVIDYKTGGDLRSREEDLSQMRNYVSILKEIYPDKQVEGLIAYVDLGEVRRIS